MTNYLFNTTIVPPVGDLTVSLKKVTLEQAEKALNDWNEGTSRFPFYHYASEHTSSEVISDLLGFTIPMRRRINLKGGDKVLAFKRTQRIDEGTRISKQELKTLEYEFWLMEVEETS